MLPQIVCGCEHQSLAGDKNFDKIKKYLSENSSGRKKQETLGLHHTQDGICPGNFIGAVWVGEGENRVVLRIDSKFKNPTMDYMAMFAECCAHPIVGEEMQSCFDIWPEQELIEIPDADDFSFMVAVAFLRELNTLCVRHLRRHFHRNRKNFVGKVKGKILIGENLRCNIGHAERMFCEYQAISDDILENRILRAALEKTARYLSVHQAQAEKYPSLQRWVHSCRAHLQSVSVGHIARHNFRAIRNRGAFAHYCRPLHLAKAVLYHFGFNPHEEYEKETKTLPYCINSAELFERYAELQLRKQYENIISLHYPKNISGKNSGFNVSVRPDFYVPRRAGKTPLIIDAKYKEIDKSIQNSDLYQMVAYFHHFGLLDEINKGDNNERDDSDIELRLAYPWMERMPWRNLDFTEAFKCKVHLYKIECPVADSSHSETESE